MGRHMGVFVLGATALCPGAAAQDVSSAGAPCSAAAAAPRGVGAAASAAPRAAAVARRMLLAASCDAQGARAALAARHARVMYGTEWGTGDIAKLGGTPEAQGVAQLDKIAEKVLQLARSERQAWLNAIKPSKARAALPAACGGGRWLRRHCRRARALLPRRAHPCIPRTAPRRPPSRSSLRPSRARCPSA